MARMRKVAVVVLGTAAAFSPSPSSSALLPTQIALRAAEAPEDAAPPTEEGPDAAAVAAGATAATAAGATMLSAAGTACAGGACAVGASAAAPAAAGVLGGLGAQLAAALGALGLSAGVAFAGGGDELAAMARDGMDLQTAFGASKPVVLEFYSKDCAHCRESSKRLHDVERAHPEVSWVMVDTQDESNRVLWERLGVDEIPHFAFLDAGKELRRTEVGPISTDRAEAGIRSVVIPGM
jgi:thiol-disulfide isomerase/thioredoxin